MGLIATFNYHIGAFRYRLFVSSQEVLHSTALKSFDREMVRNTCVWKCHTHFLPQALGVLTHPCLCFCPILWTESTDKIERQTINEGDIWKYVL